MKEFLAEFRGRPLSHEQIATGMHLCFCNAKELFQDAELLKKNQRLARALSVVILSLEELAKVALLANGVLYPRKDNAKWKQFWKSFNSHSHKQLVWSVYGGLLEKFGNSDYGDRYPGGLQPLIDKMKQMGFYVNYFNEQFVKPSDFAKDNKEWIDWIFDLARKRIESFSHLHDTLDKSRRVVNMGKEIIESFVRSGSEDEFKKTLENMLIRMKDEQK